MNVKVTVTDGFQVNHQGDVYGPGETFTASKEEADKLLAQGLVHPFQASSKKGTARNK
jgi:hypothetical protein